MKRLTFLLFLSLPFFANAQLGNYEEVVYLKNGSVIRGIIVEQIPGKSLKIKSGDNIFAFTIEEVEKFTKELILRPKPELYNPTYGGNKAIREKKEFNPKYKPKGAYLLFGLGGGASQISAGLGAELTLGGKIFNKKDWTKRSKIGGDIWFFAGVQGVPSGGGNIQLGLNAGPTIARRFGTNNYFYVTPYIGMNIMATREKYRFFNQNTGFDEVIVDWDAGIAAPIGLKLELTHKRFYIGNNIAIGGMISGNGFGGYFRTSINVGVKF